MRGLNWFLMVVCFIYLGMVFVALHTENACIDWATVLYVGTCDKEGYCAVAYPDKSYSREYKPVKGEERCRQTEEVFKW